MTGGAIDGEIKHVDTRILKHSHDADEAMKAFEGRTGEVITIDAATNKRLLRIIDWNLMPVCVSKPGGRTPLIEITDHVCGLWSKLP